MMSQSMAAVDVSREPADGEFSHPLSGRRYKIYREGSELRQRETLTGLHDGQDLVLADFPVSYVVGSGHFSRTYLSEIDGFVVEAPATWFAAKQGWDMSPGYDQPFPDGFERAATENCLYCHAGRIEALEGALHKIKIREAAIGCERCHGPGELHVEHWNAASRNGDLFRPERKATDVDFTIVNPAHLPRDLAEAVCQQCHLTSAAQVSARGRKLSEYRPGLPLQDFFMSYRVQENPESMKVVGHFDQLALSPCYRLSETLTCLTCHNPHDKPRPEERGEYFRAICTSCHQSGDCRGNNQESGVLSTERGCTDCHMPGVKTEIVHLAFTHHRIGIHRPAETSNPETEASNSALEPWHDLSRLRDIDRIRSLGLAYYDRSFDPGPHSAFSLNQARHLLEEARFRGLREGQVDGALAQILGQSVPSHAVDLAVTALADPEIPAAARIRALFLLATDHYRQERYAQAIELVDELRRLRRSSSDWALLGYCRLAMDDASAATAAFEKALELNPRMLPVHRELASLYQAAGHTQQAARRLTIGERFSKLGSRSPRPHP
jgi:predicted CXXCH cytochrome family protein